MCSSYDYSQEALDELKETLESVSSEVQQAILDDDVCKYFLSELNIELQKRE